MPSSAPNSPLIPTPERDAASHEEVAAGVPVPGSAFAALGLEPAMVDRLVAGGYAAPTAIQAEAIPALLAGRDVVGQAQTGTGKTAAFSLPMLHQIDVGQRRVQGLVLCPTRELAIQVSDALTRYGESRKIRVLTVYGGVPLHTQTSALRAGVHVVVGTPGRVKDCIERRALSLDAVRHVVLDEADEMLRMGFIEDVEEILTRVPAERQTALFSATLPFAIQRVAESYLRDPVHVRIEQRTRTVERIEQRVLFVHATDKVDVLTRVVEAEPTDATLVFARTRNGCDQLVEALRARGVPSAALHGDLSQDQREKIVGQLRDRKIQLVVATDVAARGLDVEGISHVINFDPPSDSEIYVHRIGRTGRAGRAGVSILMLTPKQRSFGRTVERFTGQPMTPMAPPSNADLLAGRVARLQSEIRERIADTEADLAPYRAVIDSLTAAPDLDVRDVAAALAALATRERPLVITEPEPGSVRHDRKRGGDDRPVERLFVALGRQAGVRPSDLVGAIANEARIPGRDIGAIDVREKVAFVEVPADKIDAIVDRMKRVTIRGRSVTFLKARPGSFERGHTSGPTRGRFEPRGRSDSRDDDRRPRRERPFEHKPKKPHRKGARSHDGFRTDPVGGRRGPLR